MTDELAASFGSLFLGERQAGIASSRHERRTGREHTTRGETTLRQSALTTPSFRANDPTADRNSRAVREAANLYLQADRPGQRMKTKQQREVLPICEHEDEIVQHIASHRVTCIQGETGCGKSSMVPQFLLEHYERNSPSFVKYLPPKAAREYQANIVVTQPRRLAAKTLAQRVASNLGEETGETVGYAIARDTKRSADTRITYVTTGYLLQLLVSRPNFFQRYSHVILDEIHERQIDSDLLSLVIKLCMAQQCKTKVIVMSATLQGKLFSRYFSESAAVDTHRRKASIPEPIFVGARRYPVDEIYLEEFLRLRDLTAALSTKEIKSIAKAWISFDAKTSPDLAGTILQHIRTVNRPEILKDREMDMGAINFAVRKQRSKDPWPQIQDGLLEVGEKLITTFSKPGETTLVFLPGMADIQEMYEKLEPYELNPRGKNIHIFVLHSQIPNDEQEAAFRDPPSDTVHVVLATNIAESSLTIPKVRIVIDYGLRKQCVYNPARQMSSIHDTWISQASAEQRKGRTGRVFKGFVFRMYTKKFFVRGLEEFDPPEMEISPLDKLVLRIKWIGRNIAPGESVRELLNQAVQPPPLEQLEAAIERLGDVGALTDYSEEADITLVGHAVLRLPLDLLQCRLVVYGIIMGCPCDAIVMAASMMLRQEPFSLPLRMIMKDPKKYLNSLTRSFTSRIKFDSDLYSEPIMMRNLFLAWLEHVRASGSQDTGLTHYAEGERSCLERYSPARTASRVNTLRKNFCRDNALHCKRFKEFENSVAEVASRVIGFVSEESEGCRKVTNLMRILSTEGDDDVVLDIEDDDITDGATAASNVPSRVKSATKRKSSPTEWFSQNSNLLKALLVAAFSPTFIEGTCFDEVKPSKLQLVNKCEKTASAMQRRGFDPKKTVALNNILEGNPELKRDRTITREIIKLTCDPQRIDCAGTYDRIFIEFSYDSEMPQDMSLLHDVPFKAHLLSQFGEGRNRFTVPLPKYTRAFRVCRREQLDFQQPVQPYKLHWNFARQKKEESMPHVLQAFITNWRNPIGFACDTRGRQIHHYAVAGEIKGDPTKCHVNWVTVLPSEDDGFLAKIMMLAFISQNTKVEFTLSDEPSFTVRKVKLSGLSLTFSQQFPLTNDILSKINQVRMVFSTIFKECSEDRHKIPDCAVNEILMGLFRACETPQASAPIRTRGETHEIEVSPFATSFHAKRKDTFTILEPFDLNKLSTRQRRSSQEKQQRVVNAAVPMPVQYTTQRLRSSQERLQGIDAAVPMPVQYTTQQLRSSQERLRGINAAVPMPVQYTTRQLRSSQERQTQRGVNAAVVTPLRRVLKPIRRLSPQFYN